MRTFTNDTVQEYILRNQRGTNFQCGWIIEYKDDTGTWQTLEDAISFSHATRNTNERSTLYQLIPTADTFSFKVLNDNQKYNAGGEYENVLERNREVRLRLLWRIPSSLNVTKEYTVPLKGRGYHAAVKGLTIQQDAEAEDEHPFLVSSPLYDSTFYGEAAYAPAGYFVMSPVTRFYDNMGTMRVTNIYCMRTGFSNVSLLYRTFNGAWSAWSAEIPLSIYDNDIPINVMCDYIQIAFIFYSQTWDEADMISDIKITYAAQTESFNLGTFYMNKPEFPNAEIENTVDVECYNLAKQIYDKTITTKKYNTLIPVSEFIIDVLTQAGLTSNQYDIPVTTTTIRNPTLYESTAVGDILEDALNKLQLEGDYRLFIKNNKLTLAVIETDRESDYVLDDRWHNFETSLAEDAENQATYVTVFSDEITFDEESDGEVDLLTSAVTGSAPGTIDITNFKTSPVNFFPAVEVRAIVTTTGDFQVREVYRKIHTSSAAARFEITGTSGTYSIMLKGVVLTDSVNVGFHSEHAGDGMNQRNALGKAITIVNQLIDNDADANALAQFIYSYNSDKKRTLSISCIPVPQLELNDNITIVTRVTDLNIYAVTSISLSGDAEYGVMKMNVDLVDNGQDFSDFVYDRNGEYEGFDDIKYDTGMVWDMDLPMYKEDETEYEKNILFSEE